MRKIPSWILTLLVLSLVAAACSGGDGGGDSGSGDAGDGASDGGGGGTSSDIVSTYIGEPESLVTLNATESEGIAVLRSLYTGLVKYDVETNEPVMAVASDIATEDNQTYTVTLNEGWTFHDGTPVTAESFVNAWNYGALGSNAQQNAAFFSDIAGYADLQCGTTTQADEETGEDVEVADCEGSPPPSEEMSGLTVNSDTEFTIELSAPQSYFITRLGYPAYSPLPQAFFDDPDAFNEQPIGNGPLMMDGAWQHNQVINTVRFEDFAGEDSVQVGGVEFRIYDDINTAVNDLLAGNLDIVDQIPPERAPEVEGQVANFESFPSSSINYLGFPLYDDQWGGDENAPLRQALSMAIDRQAIATAIFNDTQDPASNFLAPVIPGYEEQVSGCDNWSYNPELAAQRLEEWGGSLDGFTVYYNAGASHETWIEAVANLWSENLGINVQNVAFEGVQPFGDYLTRLDNQQIDGPFRIGWGMDYPHPQNYLQIVLGGEAFFPASGGANTTFYDSEEFLSTLDQALAETDLDASLPLYQDAVRIACEDVPVIPIYYSVYQTGWSENVSGVTVDAFGDVVYTMLSTSG